MIATGTIRAPRGPTLGCKGWHQEAALRMLCNNLDPEVAERPGDLVVYGGTGKAARSWGCFRAIVAELQALENDETLLVQSGKPVGVFRTHEHAPRVLIANSNLSRAGSFGPETSCRSTTPGIPAPTAVRCRGRLLDSSQGTSTRT